MMVGAILYSRGSGPLAYVITDGTLSAVVVSGICTSALLFGGGFLMYLAATPVWTTHPDVTRYLSDNKQRIDRLFKEIVAFDNARPKLALLKDRTERYAGVVALSNARYAELQRETDELLAPVEAIAQRIRNANRIAELKNEIGALLPANTAPDVTQDLSAHIAVIEAGERIEREAAPEDVRRLRDRLT